MKHPAHRLLQSLNVAAGVPLQNVSTNSPPTSLQYYLAPKIDVAG